MQVEHPLVIAHTDNLAHDSNLVPAQTILNPEGIQLTVDLQSAMIPINPPISSAEPSEIATRDSNIINTKAWADLAEAEDDAPKHNKCNKGGRKIPSKTSTATRSRRGHVPNPSL